jgi:hypothetical protein
MRCRGGFRFKQRSMLLSLSRLLPCLLVTDKDHREPRPSNPQVILWNNSRTRLFFYESAIVTESGGATRVRFERVRLEKEH